MTPPLDWARFLTLAAEGEGLPDLVGFYIEYVSERLEALRLAVDAGAAVQIEQIAHQMAGSNAIAGATAIVPPLLALEAMAHENRLDAAAAAFADAEVAYGLIREFLTRELETRGPHA